MERVVRVEREMDEVQAYNDELLQKIERAISDTERLIINLEKQCNDLRHDFQPYADKYNEKINLVHNVIPKLQADKYNCNYYNEELKKQRQQLERADLKKKAVSIARYDVGQDEWAYYLTDFERYKELYYGDVDYSISLKFRRSLQMLIEEMQPLIGKAEYGSVLEKKLSRYKYKSEDVERVRKDNVLAYMELLKDNVLEYNVCDYILCMINCNHILSKRGELIQKAISCFADNEYIQFINIIAIQIEGLFFDIYTQLGFSPRKLDAISLKPKVEEIDRKTNEIGTGYFMFYFPILRNKVAHGILWDSEEDSVK